jgi:hypothetical protein
MTDAPCDEIKGPLAPAGIDPAQTALAHGQLSPIKSTPAHNCFNASRKRPDMRSPHQRHGADGMSGLPLMPFPFLNPWNWGAMTPARALAASIFLLRCSLDGWRHVADAMRASLQQDQDAMLRAFEQALVEPTHRRSPLAPQERSGVAKRKPRKRRAARVGGAA